MFRVRTGWPSANAHQRAGTARLRATTILCLSLAILSWQTAAGAKDPTAPTAVQASDWNVPDLAKLADDAFGRAVRRGHDLIVSTSSLIGPDAADPKMRFSGNRLDCASCHLDAGTRRFGLPLAGTWGIFPQYIARENQVRTLEDRINGCMERSMNGRPLPVDGADMKSMLSYIRFISNAQPTGTPMPGRGTPPLPLPGRASDPRHGKQIFASVCAMCHGPDGQGKRPDASDAAATGRYYLIPPLWGPDSYNDGAGMARTITAAQFIHANMPLGTTYQSPVLSVGDAFDVAAFIDSQPRPHKSGLQQDYPDRLRKPVDAAYPPWPDPFPPEQHWLGPWQPILQWLQNRHPAMH